LDNVHRKTLKEVLVQANGKYVELLTEEKQRADKAETLKATHREDVRKTGESISFEN